MRWRARPSPASTHHTRFHRTLVRLVALGAYHGIWLGPCGNACFLGAVGDGGGVPPPSRSVGGRSSFRRDGTHHEHRVRVDRLSHSFLDLLHGRLGQALERSHLRRRQSKLLPEQRAPVAGRSRLESFRVWRQAFSEFCYKLVEILFSQWGFG